MFVLLGGYWNVMPARKLVLKLDEYSAQSVGMVAKGKWLSLLVRMELYLQLIDLALPWEGQGYLNPFTLLFSHDVLLRMSVLMKLFIRIS
ncbi:hypothetical protein Nepgr_026540 [Nepenthes gracilis]|uniref:Uncharacterized protein n=1 Tax=Nepenthes gracilis TaxID=150966 RepID=A0AAD3T8F6_NEPGR|nr:hypothetical protein Nepgr_026540 [Nepenthes gracilis]